MSGPWTWAGPAALAMVLGLGSNAHSAGAGGSADTAVLDTPAALHAGVSAAGPATFPAPPEMARDTPPAREPEPTTGSGTAGMRVSPAEYEGWRQYSVHCARCHGQDALPNPVAANLLVSLAPGGPSGTEQTFCQVVSAGRAAGGMPAFKTILSPEKIRETYAYLKGRADGRIPPGRPQRPA